MSISVRISACTVQHHEEISNELVNALLSGLQLPLAQTRADRLVVELRVKSVRDEAVFP